MGTTRERVNAARPTTVRGRAPAAGGVETPRPSAETPRPSAEPLAPEVFVELVAASPEAKLVLDRSGRILYANAQAVQLVGALDSELVGQPIDLFVPTRLHARLTALAEAWRSAPFAVAMGELEDTYLRLADGAECPVDVSITPVDSAGLPLVAVVLRDVRAQRLAESRLRHMLETAPDGMLVVDDEGTIVFANSRAGEMLRCPAAALVDRDVEQFVPREWRGGPTGGPERSPAEGRARSLDSATRHLLVERDDGTRFPADISLSSLSAGEEHRVVVAVRDASERASLHFETQRLREELISTVSHELRTPLASIIGYTELLAEMGEEHLSDTARQMLDVIAKNAAREHKLVSDLLASSRDRLTDRLDLAAVDLRSVVADAAQQAAPAAAAAGIAVEVEPQDERIAVLADLQRVRELVEHVLENAIKFNVAGGHVRVSVWYEDRSATLRIADEGIGMSAHEASQACDRLYRAPVAVDEHLPGAGLGLTLARDIVDAHGGGLGIESDPGRGTVVTVSLPIGGP